MLRVHVVQRESVLTPYASPPPFLQHWRIRTPNIELAPII